MKKTKLGLLIDVIRLKIKAVPVYSTSCRIDTEFNNRDWSLNVKEIAKEVGQKVTEYIAEKEIGSTVKRII